MGNKISNVCEYLYIIKVRNPALPLCPFIHCIISYNSIPIKNTDPAVFKNILSKSNLILEIMDLRNLNKFFITIPKGMEKLGLNVIKLKKIPNILRIMVINVKENAILRKDDRILGIENLYLFTENDLIDYIKNNVGETINMIIIRNNNVITEEITLTNDLGCELGIGILYNLEDTIYYNKEYNREIKISKLETKNEENKNKKEDLKINDKNLETISNKDGNSVNVDIKQNDVNGNPDNNDTKKSDINDKSNDENIKESDINDKLDNKDIKQSDENINQSDVNSKPDNKDIKQSDVNNNLENKKEFEKNTNENNNIQIDNNMRTEAEEKKETYYNDSDSIILNEREELFLKNKITSDKYFLKESKLDEKKDGIVMIGSDLVNTNDFVKNENGFQMKEKAFEKLKNNHEKSLDISESKDEKLKSDDLKHSKINEKGYNSKIDDTFSNNEKSITNLFSDDEEFSFNNSGI